jgi:murein DD-endopeptidase MepM/ murein hydrolase activator NlpD
MHRHPFVIDVASSTNGQIKRIHLSKRFLAISTGSLAALSLLVLGFVSSYVHLTLRVRNYEHLQTDFNTLRTQYSQLREKASEHQAQMESLETLASEVSVAYGINRPVVSNGPFAMDADSPATLKDSIQQYGFLKNAGLSGMYHHYAFRWQVHNDPSLWPVDGVLRSSFGGRSDPFSGEGEFHTGVDIQATVGTPVSVTADGVVENAGWSGRYGKLVVVNHGSGIQTYYAHLSAFLVVPGEEVRRGQQIALSGSTGHVTGPHVHYEVRVSGTPVNPYRYMAKAPKPAAPVVASDRIDASGFGL